MRTVSAAILLTCLAAGSLLCTGCADLTRPNEIAVVKPAAPRPAATANARPVGQVEE